MPYFIFSILNTSDLFFPNNLLLELSLAFEKSKPNTSLGLLFVSFIYLLFFFFYLLHLILFFGPNLALQVMLLINPTWRFDDIPLFRQVPVGSVISKNIQNSGQNSA